MAPEPADPWALLRASFTMADCDADPAVQAWAKRYTRNPRQFEGRLRAVLPRLLYVQQVTAQYEVPGEFALLPWVESRFQPVTARRGRPAGMWQIMPATAGAMGLRIDSRYDGRLDVPAATHAVMKLLSEYHQQFNDWRVAAYAYNAGAFATAKFIDKHGLPPAQPLIPAWPVRDVTRQHLTQLLAIACVVREPEAFGVTLPMLTHEEHLVKVPISGSMPMTQAARRAGMSVDALKQVNAGFRHDTIDASVASYLLLPVSHARQFRAALPDQTDALTAQTGSTPPRTVRSTAGDGDGAGKPRHVRTHTVRSGDNLWQIARRYSVNVSELRRWNDLQQQVLRPGQVLEIRVTN